MARRPRTRRPIAAGCRLARLDVGDAAADALEDRVLVTEAGREAEVRRHLLGHVVAEEVAWPLHHDRPLVEQRLERVDAWPLVDSRTKPAVTGLVAE